MGEDMKKIDLNEFKNVCRMFKALEEGFDYRRSSWESTSKQMFYEKLIDRQVKIGLQMDELFNKGTYKTSDKNLCVALDEESTRITTIYNKMREEDTELDQWCINNSFVYIH